MKTVMEASVNDLLLNYVQAYVNWLAHPDTPLAFEDNQLMVSIQAEFNRREGEMLRLQIENNNLRLQYNACMEQFDDCMEQLDPFGDEAERDESRW